MSTEIQFDNFKYSKPVAQNIAGSLAMGFGAGIMAFDSPNANKTVATAMLLGSTLYGASKSLAFFLMLPFALIADTGRNLYYVYNNININELEAIGSDISTKSSPRSEGEEEEGGEEVENYLTSVIHDNTFKPESSHTIDIQADTESKKCSPNSIGSISRTPSWDFLSSPTSKDPTSAKVEKFSPNKFARP